jgi:cell division ATPase FtsA
VALVGGGACAPGVAEIARRRLGAPAVVGGVSTVPGLEQAMCSAPFATAAGLLRWACERPPEADASFARRASGRLAPAAGLGKALSKAWRWLEASF